MYAGIKKSPQGTRAFRCSVSQPVAGTVLKRNLLANSTRRASSEPLFRLTLDLNLRPE